MENINNGLFDNIIDQKMYKNLTEIFDEVKEKKKTEQYLINYCKKHFMLKKYILLKFINKNFSYSIYEKLFMKLIDLLTIDFIINHKDKNLYIIILYFIFKNDYKNFDLFMTKSCGKCNYCYAYCFFNKILFFKVILTENYKFINKMFDILFLFLDNRIIDEEDYNYMIDIINDFKKISLNPFYHLKIDILTNKLKNSYISY